MNLPAHRRISLDFLFLVSPSKDEPVEECIEAKKSKGTASADLGHSEPTNNTIFYLEKKQYQAFNFASCQTFTSEIMSIHQLSGIVEECI
jgi:hypothetical protein